VRGILSIIIGTIFIVGGLSGKLAPGAQNGRQLALVGGVIIVIGLVRIARG
jgi:hypothetical protein